MEDDVRIQKAKSVLLAKKSELNSRQVSRDDIAIERNAEVLDEIQQHADRTLALDTLTRRFRTAALVAEALDRVDDGSYGTCANCEEPIPEKRLDAIPWAKYCIACQEIADKSEGDIDLREAA
jgi:DnaK suppressor protein